MDVRIPEKLYREIVRRGLDIESFVLSLIVNSLDLDPEERKEVGIELAKRFLEEGRSLVDKDPVQASEKLYKAVEECVKVLAVHFNLSEVLSRVESRGRWTVENLIEAVRAITKHLGSWFLQSWDMAWVLHVWGFHEAKLNGEDVAERIPYVERVVEKTVEIVGSK